MIPGLKVPPSLAEKVALILGTFSPHRRIAVAYSGGVDSTFLAWLVQNTPGKEAYAFLVVTPFLSQREHAGAMGVAREIGLLVEPISLDPSSIPLVRQNPVDRCYHCKKEVMKQIKRRAEELDCSVVVDGSHAGDRTGNRPGRRALYELGVCSPLALAGLEKHEIRELSRLAGLSTWNKPSQSCLATRLPYGTELTHETLSRVEQAEEVLWGLGCEQVRVRYDGETARIEINPDAFHLILDQTTRASITLRLRQLGFIHVTLDLAGYRSGSWDERPSAFQDI
jgi:pyridinium-3,5-biscarboxylic acid mononucleotide sulfurtransferase